MAKLIQRPNSRNSFHTSVGKETMGAYNNPILPGFNPDPSIVRVGPDYFLVTSTFEYFPGVPIYHSRDLVRWTLIGHALTRRSQLDVRTPETGGGVWAPTIRHHDGAFYVATACFDRYRPQADEERVWPRGFYVRNEDVWDEGGWSDPVWFDQVGFDQDEKMQLGWYRKNTPLKEDFSLTERPGHLRLYGGPYTLSTPACPTLFLRKQTHDPVTWETKLSFRPDSARTEAGAVVYWNQHTYSSIGIRRASENGTHGGRIIRVRPAEGETRDFELKSSTSDVVLTIKSDHGYELGFREEFGLESEVEIQWVGRE
ncbi:hypothetical protein SLS55_006062 [Diplodia seriata]|uniref:Beta-xylosidase C-terminal Concanavalin A-like domain-containing protein n=1 Tax=Diplodia seriata TaxID=420778 RepID=A0ABR3CD63_9PEZI